LESALLQTCTDFIELFRALEPGIGTNNRATSSSMAQTQCLRLLDLAQSFVLWGRSTIQAPSGIRRERGGGGDDSVAVLPLGKLVQVIDLVLTTVFHDTIGISNAVAKASSSSSPLAALLDKTVELLGSVADVVGCAILPYATKVRRWLTIIVDAPLSVHKLHNWPVCTLVPALSRSAPALLIHRQLVKQLVDHTLEVLSAVVDCTINAVPAPPAAVPGGSARRKRKASEVLDSSADIAGRTSGTQDMVAAADTVVYPAACQVLHRVLALAAPIVGHNNIARICEQVVRVLWLGLMAPASASTGVAGVHSSVGSPKMSAVVISCCQRLCRRPSSMYAILDLIEILYQQPRPGAPMLAPTLVDAFTALLNAAAAAHRQRNSGHQLSIRGSRHCLDRHQMFAEPSVFTRALQVKSTILASAGADPSAGLNDIVKGSSINIVWPEFAISEASIQEAAAPEPMDTMQPVSADRRSPPKSGQFEQMEASPDGSTPIRTTAEIKVGSDFQNAMDIQTAPPEVGMEPPVQNGMVAETVPEGSTASLLAGALVAGAEQPQEKNDSTTGALGGGSEELMDQPEATAGASATGATETINQAETTAGALAGGAEEPMNQPGATAKEPINQPEATAGALAGGANDSINQLNQPGTTAGALAGSAEEPMNQPEATAGEGSKREDNPSQDELATVSSAPRVSEADAAPPSVEAVASVEGVTSNQPLELFSDDEDGGSPIPELCADSPSDDAGVL